GGEVRAEVRPWGRSGALSLEKRGGLVAIRGTAGGGPPPRGARGGGQGGAKAPRGGPPPGAGRGGGGGARPPEGRLPPPAGCFLLLEAVFEEGRAAFGVLGERRVRAEALGDRAARRLLRFLDADEGAVDPWLADQLVVPMALSGAGGRVTTPEVTAHLETVADVV